LMSPASCRIRRTSVSEIPSASNRFSTSRIRRVPHSSFSCFRATTRSLRNVPLGPRCALPRLDSRADIPCLRKAVVHFITAAADTPNAKATSFSLVPRSRSCTTRSLYSGVNSRVDFRGSVCFFFAMLSPGWLTRVSSLGGAVLGD
jgi:hypothetical protein